MKLCRIGKAGDEKPAMIDNENNFRDISSVVQDLDRNTLNFETLEKLKNLDLNKLPVLD